MKRYGLIGKELQHSFSPKYFKEKFKRENIEASYELFPMDSLKNLRAWIGTQPFLEGFNVTIPFKEEILEHLDQVDEIATAIGAVNTVRVKHLGGGAVFLKGYNTDWIGFKLSVLPFLESMPQPIRKALVLGTGGASKAIIYGLHELGISHSFVSRSPQSTEVLGYSDLTEEVMLDHLLIINTTPVGMYPLVDGQIRLPFHSITSKHIAYDLVYNPPVTRFLEECAKRGAHIKNGQEMLEIQAHWAYELFIKD